jgi:hypothetical protein
LAGVSSVSTEKRAGCDRRSCPLEAAGAVLITDMTDVMTRSARNIERSQSPRC